MHLIRCAVHTAIRPPLALHQESGGPRSRLVPGNRGRRSRRIGRASAPASSCAFPRGVGGRPPAQQVRRHREARAPRLRAGSHIAPGGGVPARRRHQRRPILVTNGAPTGPMADWEGGGPTSGSSPARCGCRRPATAHSAAVRPTHAPRGGPHVRQRLVPAMLTHPNPQSPPVHQSRINGAECIKTKTPVA